MILNAMNTSQIRARLHELRPREMKKGEGVTWARSPAEYAAESQHLTQELLRLNIEAILLLVEKTT